LLLSCCPEASKLQTTRNEARRHKVFGISVSLQEVSN
jgi:hypothetical protein